MKKYNYKIFNNRKEVIQHINHNIFHENNRFDLYFHPWDMISRRYRLYENDGYFLLFYDYFEQMKKDFHNFHGAEIDRIYDLYRLYDTPNEFILFTVKMPNTKECRNEKFLDYKRGWTWKCNKNIRYFLMSDYFVRSRDKKYLTALYQEVTYYTKGANNYGEH